MESIKSTIEYLVKEGAVIGGAPLTFLVFFIGAALLLSKFLSWWHRREIDGFKSTVENLRSHVQLCNARIDGLKTEADNLRNALEKDGIFSVVATPEAAKMYQLIDELHSVAG